MGEAVKDDMDVGVINLGDPVVRLKKIKKVFSDTGVAKKFDSTIGKLVSQDEDIASYQVFDYNKDERKDVLLIKKDNYFKLLENTLSQENFLDKGNLAYIADL